MSLGDRANVMAPEPRQAAWGGRAEPGPEDGLTLARCHYFSQGWLPSSLIPCAQSGSLQPQVPRSFIKGRGTRTAEPSWPRSQQGWTAGPLLTLLLPPSLAEVCSVSAYSPSCVEDRWPTVGTRVLFRIVALALVELLEL